MYRQQAYNILESKKNIFHDIEIICLILCLRYVLEDYSFKKIKKEKNKRFSRHTNRNTIVTKISHSFQRWFCFHRKYQNVKMLFSLLLAAVNMA